MQKNSLYLLVAVFLMAMAFVGCSHENPIAPISAEDGMQVDDGSNADKVYRLVSVNGEVHLMDGSPAGNTEVLIQAKVGNGPWVTHHVANTFNNPNGTFYAQWIINCDDGTLIRCVSLGDFVEKEVNHHSDIYYFSLAEQKARPPHDDLIISP